MGRRRNLFLLLLIFNCLFLKSVTAIAKSPQVQQTVHKGDVNFVSESEWEPLSLTEFDAEDVEDFVEELERLGENGNDEVTNETRQDEGFLPVGKVTGVVLMDDDEEDEDEGDDFFDQDPIENRSSGDKAKGKSERIAPDPVEEFMSEDDEEDEDFPLPRDLGDLKEDVADEVTLGIEEYLRLCNNGSEVNNSSEAETRQLPMYLFQGHYAAEPRLNLFVDGAMRNMMNEMKTSNMDPIYFRVLPKGLVGERTKGGVRRKKKSRTKKRKRRRPAGGRRRRSLSELDEEFEENDDMLFQTEKEDDELLSLPEPQDVESGRTINVRRRRQQAARRKRQRARRRAAARRRKRRQRQRNKRKNKKNRFGFRRPGFLRRRNNKKNKVKNNTTRKKKKNKRTKRQKRFAKRNVGGGKVEGLSRVLRDGDAEMQLFGNYTLIRSHMKIGPIDLSMQFRTRRGIRRTGATLPPLRVHTVTRVNHEGSEMVDFLVDRPHPEIIQVRGKLYPMARKIAKNVFSRLFLPDSFVISKVREKAGLALLSRPTGSSGGDSTVGTYSG